MLMSKNFIIIGKYGVPSVYERLLMSKQLNL